MNQIHPTAIIDRSVQLGDGNEIGPHVIIEPGVRIGSGNRILANVCILKGTELGNDNEIHMGAVLGNTPQDKVFRGGETFTKIGNANVIREYVTIHRGTKEGTATVIGDRNYFMANAHVAHNCKVASDVVLVNFASLSGYCVVEDQAFLSGMVGLHQFTRVGRLAILSALSAVNKDVPPFVLCGGRPARVQGLNFVGLRRAGILPEVRREIKEAFRILYRSGYNVSQALEAIDRDFHSEEARYLADFIRASERGICDGARARKERVFETDES